MDVIWTKTKMNTEYPKTSRTTKSKTWYNNNSTS